MTRMMRMCLIAALVALAGLSCAKKEPPQVENFSFAPPDGAVVTHIDLDLTVDFERQRLHGTASFDIDNEAGADKLYLDTWALLIDSVNLGDLGAQTDWTLGDSLALLGRPLIIDIKPGTRRVSVHYRTGEDARGLQWLRPEQTGDGKHPFLYTQSQAILARTWVPCQDHPAARITYRARIHTPPELIALMSARNPREKNPDGEYTFEMPQPIPTYLLALAVGDLAYGAVSDRCGVYASPAMLEQALWEFNDMERMAQVAEELYGPYRWEQFDVLVLPPSFPYGGMENPRLTFATPILVAGDRSLVSTIAHELAHSWSGNLVTNATWNDFWLNEGFTTYFTQRIMEELYGREVSEMHAMLGRERLEQAIEEAGPDKLTTALYVPLGDSDPDEELGTAAYQKGYLFLRLLEESFGRERFDAFLAEYFDTFAFETMTTEAFLEHMFIELFDGDDDMMEKLRVDEWVYRPGLPDNAPQAESPRFDRVDLAAAAFVAGKPAVESESGEWTTQEWERFLAYFDQPLTVAQLDDLLRTFDFSSSNGVVQRSWYLVAIENEYDLEYPAIREYLMKVGRTWLIRPIYTELASTTRGMEFARDVYRDARPGYHSVTRTTIDGILGAPERAN